MKIIFNTGNINKFKEVRENLIDYNITHEKIEIEEIQSTDLNKIIIQKCIDSSKKINLINDYILVEDSAFYVDNMNNLPGPLIKFFLQELSLENNYKIFSLFSNKIKIKTIFGLIKNNKIKLFEGEQEYILTNKNCNKEKCNNFGFDCILLFNNKHVCEYSIHEKNKFSHRIKAIEKVKIYLKE